MLVENFSTSKTLSQPPLRTEAAWLSITGRVERRSAVRIRDGVLGNSPKQIDEIYAGVCRWLVKHGSVTSTVSPGLRYPLRGRWPVPGPGQQNLKRSLAAKSGSASREYGVGDLSEDSSQSGQTWGQVEHQDDEIQQRTKNRWKYRDPYRQQIDRRGEGGALACGTMLRGRWSWKVDLQPL